RIGKITPDIREIGLCPHRPEMGADPAWRLLGAKPEALRQFKRQRATDGHPLAMQKTVGIAGGVFQRVTEGMTEVQKRALSLFGLIALDDACLHLDRARH